MVLAPNFMLRERFFFLLVFGISSFMCQQTAAQTGKDTVFTFYYNTGIDTLSIKQQKELERLLQNVQRIKSVTGFTDTVGSEEHNKELSLGRALMAFYKLPEEARKDVTVNAAGETTTSRQLWRNRRTEIAAVVYDNPQTRITVTPADTTSSSVTELQIDQIFFVPDQPVLTAASMQYVQTLARQLLQYEGAHFQIIGHVNYQSDLPPERLPDLYELSQQRAKAVHDLLVQNDIPTSRMTYKGVGNSQPLIANPASDSEKRKNMRVQVLIVQQ